MKIIRFFRNIYICLLVSIIAFLSIFLISSLFSKTSYTKTFGYSFFEVQSYSMYPKLKKGDLIVVKELKDEEYEVGMTVTYIRENETIPTTHEIVKIEGNIITTRGINTETNNTDDEPFDVSCIIGEVIFTFEKYGEIRSFITNPLGIIIVLLSGFFIIEGFNYLESLKKKEEKN